MSVIILFFYIFIIITIVVNVLKISKSFRENGRVFDNIEGIVRQRYNNLMKSTDNRFDENKVVNDTDTYVDLDNFMKSNSNPIKEVKGKRSNI